nr:hypothetical protein [Rhizocola hellebori]
MTFNEGKHPLKLSPVYGLGAFASVDEDFDHFSVKGFGFAFAGFALCGQGVAVRVVVLVCLFGGRHPQVDNGSFARVAFGQCRCLHGCLLLR